MFTWIGGFRFTWNRRPGSRENLDRDGFDRVCISIASESRSNAYQGLLRIGEFYSVQINMNMLIVKPWSSRVPRRRRLKRDRDREESIFGISSAVELDRGRQAVF